MAKKKIGATKTVPNNQLQQYANAMQQAVDAATLNASMGGQSLTAGYAQTAGSTYLPQVGQVAPNTVTQPNWLPNVGGGAGGGNMGNWQQWQVPNQQTVTPIGMMTEDQLDQLAGVVLKRVMDALKTEDKETLRKLLRGKV